MKIVGVLVNVETTCAKCGGPTEQLCRATVTTDGRIGEPIPNAGHLCQKCLLAEKPRRRPVELKLIGGGS